MAEVYEISAINLRRKKDVFPGKISEKIAFFKHRQRLSHAPLSTKMRPEDNKSATMQYREEIDGLRSLAVLPVIFFHAGFSAFAGGFVGVDIFFVISGYLITTILINELDGGRYSIVKFYERRARRILPALFFVMLVCLPFAWAWLIPSEMKTFMKSMVAVSFFVSNILFWRESGYFESAAEFNPLLHTWSLAVEEQYYIFFPVYLALVWRFGKRFVIGSLIVISVLSLVVSQWGITHNPLAAFFLLPTRGWELLIGSLCAFALQQKRTLHASGAMANLLSMAGVSMLVFSIATYSKHTPFPGVYALAPTIGSALIILYASPQTIVGQVLGSKPFVGVGLLSYSAYLWHQPLFAFARHKSVHEPSAALFLALSALSIVLAYMSWRFVEQPFRKPQPFDRKAIFRFALVASTIAVAVGLLGTITNGYFLRHDAKAKMTVVEYKNRPTYGLDVKCDNGFTLNEKCRTSAEPEVVLWGDSYAMHLVPALLAAKPDLKLIQHTHSNCGPIVGVAMNTQKYVESWSRRCLSFNDKVLEYIRSTKSVKYVVLSSPFAQYVGTDVPVMLADGKVVDGNTVSLEKFRQTLAFLKQAGVRPVIISPTPRSKRNVGDCLARASWFDWNKSVCDFPHAAQEQAPIFAFLREIAKDAKVIWLTDEICKDGMCSATLGEHFTYRDFGHLSHEAAAHLGRKLDLYQRITTD